MGLINLPVELLEFIFSYVFPESGNYSGWQPVLDLRLVCKLFDQIALSHISRKFEVDARNKAGITTLDWAAWSGHEEMVQLLLGRKANANSRNNGKTALHRAAAHGHERVVQLLLEHKADVNASYCALTALHMAAESGHEAAVRVLLEHKARDKPGFYKLTALDMAAQGGHEAVVRLLLDHKADVPAGYYEANALDKAVENRQEAVVRLLKSRQLNRQMGRHRQLLKQWELGSDEFVKKKKGRKGEKALCW